VTTYELAWLYEVDPGARERFVEAYGPKGTWSRLFAGSPAYLGSQLIEEPGEPTRFVIVDRFTSAHAYADMLEHTRTQYAQLDRETRSLYLSERQLVPAPVARLRLDLVPGDLALCRLEPKDDVPEWAGRGPISVVARTQHELSIVCDWSVPPRTVRREGPYRALVVEGPLDLALTGIAAALVVPLAASDVPIVPVATFDTDYILVRATDVERARLALRAAGHTVWPG